MTRIEQNHEALRGILAYIMGDNPDGKVYLAEDAPAGLIVNIHRALDGAVVPPVEPVARETS